MLVTYPLSSEGAGAVNHPHPRALLLAGGNLGRSGEEVEAGCGELLVEKPSSAPSSPCQRISTTAQRNATKRAGELAGFTVERHCQ
jgi:hypothetical protein